MTGSRVPTDRRTFIGCSTETDILAALLDAVRAGESRTLVLHGEPGVGKTALLEYAIDAAAGFHVARITGVEAESELAFAALHQLCGRMLDRVDRLPCPQREALGVAFGLVEGGSPDRFLVGLAVLSLLADVAEDAPLLCVVDDAQWLDEVSAQTLAFVARRLYAESVAMVFATRPVAPQELSGLPELAVGGLVHDDALELLNRVFPGRLDERVRDRIVAETHGNPLAILELPKGLAQAELAGGFGLNRALPLSGQIEESFRRRLEALPEDTRQLLLIASAEPLGDPALLWNAAQRLAIDPGAAAPAEAAGLVEIGALVTFRHPLVRSAIYHAAALSDRRRVHAALADATDPAVDPDRRAWHRAEAAVGPDEQVALELERSAGRAQARGGLAAAAAFLERAAALTPEPARRAERELAAAQAKYEAGAPFSASELLARAVAGPLDALPRALLERLRAQIEFTLRRGSAAPPLFLRAAKLLEPLDAELARETYLEALDAALFVGKLGTGGGPTGVAAAARTAPPPPSPPRLADLLLDGLATLFTEGYTAAVPVLRRALDAAGAERRDIGCVGLACHTAGIVWDLERRHDLAALQVRLARDAGALAVLPVALNRLASVRLVQGKLSAAEALLEEADAIAEATGNVPVLHIPLLLAAWRGLETQVSTLFDESVRDGTARGEGSAVTVAKQAAALFHNGRGEFRAALCAVHHEQALDSMFGTWSLPEVVEAAALGGERKLAVAAVERLSEQTAGGESGFAVGMEARSRALVSEGGTAEELYRTAIERLGDAGAGAHLARAHLLFGEWLRRQRRRVEAREHLRTAHEAFVSMGAEGFAERASRSLLATGEHARKRTVDSAGQLTGREAQIARLARDGLTNAEISAQLFISPRTVEYHLRKVFAKLGIDSRTRLDRVLPLD